MEVTLSSQLLSLGISALVGFGVGSCLRCFPRNPYFISYRQNCYVCAGYFIWYRCCVHYFLLALAVNSGEIRFYIIGGELIGMAVYFLTLGRITVRIAKWIHRICVKIALWFKRHISEPIKGFYEKKKTAIAQRMPKIKKKEKFRTKY